MAERAPGATGSIRPGRADRFERVDVPVENLMTPDTVRRVLWRPPEDRSPAALDAATAEQGARAWQRELVIPLLAKALSDHP